MTRLNRQIHLTAYADGLPGESNFELREAPVRDPQAGEVLVRLAYLSMDPFPRLRMSGNPALAPQLPLGSVMIGRGVGRVVASRHPDFAEGDHVAGELGWQDYALTDGAGLRRVDPALAPISTALGVLGPSGLAGYFSMLRQGQPKAGETVVVAAASGAVGSVAAQIAKMQGARAIGIVGGPVQTRHVLEDLGLDAAVDYKSAVSVSAALGAVAPGGVDVFLDTVGGTIHDAVMDHLNVGARIVLVGTISNYNLGPNEVDTGPRHLYRWITKRVRLSGFLVGDYAGEFAAALADLAQWIRDGRLRYAETIFDGLEKCPAAFAALFTADNVGKMLVHVGEP
jgi:NADPH-dependent curcumin reductase CurA